MRKISFEKLITKSINRTKLILFQPFSLKKWLCFLLIGYLAGAIGGGGNFRSIGGRDSKDAEAVEQESQSGSYSGQTVDDENGEQIVLDGWTGRPKGSSKNPFCFLNSGIALGVIIGILGFFVLPFVVFFTWLSSRFKFIWFNAIISNDASIREPFDRYAKEGNSLFKFLLLILFVAIIFFGLLAFWAYSNAVSAGIFKQGVQCSIGQVLSVFAFPALVLLIGIVILTVVHVFIEHFIITIMAIERCPFLAAFYKAWGIVSHSKVDIFIYYLVLLGLGIALVILSVFVAFACVIVLLIVAALLLGLPYLLIVALFKAKLLFVIFAIIVGVPFFMVALLLLMSIGLPFAVFFRSFSLYFISSLECGYVPLSLEDAA